MQKKDEKDYAFIKEKIKDKPINKKRMVMQLAFTLFLAVLFGLVSGAVFAYVHPRLEQRLYPKEKPVFTLPPDEKEDDSESESTDGTDSESENTDGSDSEADSTQNPGTEPPGESSNGPGGEQEPIDMIQWQPTLEDYQTFWNQMYAIGAEANRFIVTVTGVQSNIDWFNNPYESKGQASGIIIGSSDQELLILTEKKVLYGAEEIYVTFADDTSVQAAIRKYDGNTGITVLSVPQSAIGEETMAAISTAVLGNSLSVPQGTLVIAVGSPLGTNYSVLTGNITSTTNSISTVDANYNIFTTDIIGSSNGSGALINLKGEVIGLVMQDYSSAGDENTLTAVSISDLKTVIQKLSNNQEIPYIGLGITTVTSAIEKEYEIPKGVYIKEVKLDSPAMAAGLQSGDVIVEIGGTVVLTEEAYEKKLLELNPGDVAGVIIKRQGNDGYVNIRCDVEISSLK